jgi:hypothetical protein
VLHNGSRQYLTGLHLRQVRWSAGTQEVHHVHSGVMAKWFIARPPELSLLRYLDSFNRADLRVITRA